MSDEIIQKLNTRITKLKFERDKLIIHSADQFECEECGAQKSESCGFGFFRKSGGFHKFHTSRNTRLQKWRIQNEYRLQEINAELASLENERDNRWEVINNEARKKRNKNTEQMFLNEIRLKANKTRELIVSLFDANSFIIYQTKNTRFLKPGRMEYDNKYLEMLQDSDINITMTFAEYYY